MDDDEHEIQVSEELNSLFLSFDLINAKLYYLKISGLSQEDIFNSLLQQTALTNSFLIKENLVDKYYTYVFDMQKEYSDYQIVLASYKERKDL